MAAIPTTPYTAIISTNGEERRLEKMSLCQWAEDDWNVLIYTLRKGKCILMLGPETAVTDEGGKPLLLSQVLANRLTQDIEPRFMAHIDPTNLLEVAQYWLQPGRGKTYLQLKLKEFYKERCSASPCPFHKDLAALPFYLTILSTPDERFETALKEYGKNPKTGRYNYQKKTSVMEAMGFVDEPLLFYLYGAIGDEESLVATENDLLDFGFIEPMGHDLFPLPDFALPGPAICLTALSKSLSNNRS